MKRKFILTAGALLICLSTNAKILSDPVSLTADNFPDEIFLNFIKSQNYDVDNDNYLSAAELATITTINCSGLGISNLSGINFFTSLTSLNCSNNNLSNLYIAKTLSTFECAGNSYAITVDDNFQYDMSTLPGNFVAANASSIVNGTLSGTLLTADGYSVKYNYNCGNGNTTVFSLSVSYKSVADINSTNFPNDKFREYISAKEFDLNLDGKLSDFEISKIKFINLSNYAEAIDNMKGIELFSALESLYCNYNSNLTGIDLSNNTKLKVLHVNNNGLLTLDVSKNTALTELYCQGNSLSELLLNSNTALTILNCSQNSLTELNIAINTQLSVLKCAGNSLSTLSIDSNPELITLDCSSNNITQLILTNNSLLTTLNCSNNNLSNINLSNTAVSSFTCTGNNYSITADVNGTYNLTDLPGQFDVLNISNILSATLDGTVITATSGTVTYLYNCGNGFNPLFTLNVKFTGKVPINSTTFPDDIFRASVSTSSFDLDQDQMFSVYEISLIKTISVSNKNITSIKGVEYFEELTSLSCDQNLITSIDLSNNKKLQIFYCTKNSVSNLILPDSQTLTKLDCSYNNISELDLSKCNNLTYFICSNNKLSVLDLSNATSLLVITCSNNALSNINLTNTSVNSFTCDNNVYVVNLDLNNPKYNLYYLPRPAGQTFDLSKMSNLTGATISDSYISPTAKNVTYNYDCGKSKSAKFTLNVNYPSITNIDAISFPDENFLNFVLEYIDTDDNNILSFDEVMNTTEIDVNQKSIVSLKGIEYFVNLSILKCYANSIMELDLSANTKLEYIDCSYNQISSLNLSNNSLLKTLDITNNLFETIDISNCTSLDILYCAENKLTSLDLSKNVNLTDLYCYSNKLTYLNFDNNALLKSLDYHQNYLSNLDLSKTKFPVLKNNVLSDDNSFTVITNGDRSFDLTSLPGNFDITKISNITGASFDGGIFVFTAENCAYDYECYTGYKVHFILKSISVKESKYVWNQDYSACTGHLVYNDATNLTLDETVAAVQETVADPTCIEDGNIRFTATFADKHFLTQIHDSTIAALGHDSIKIIGYAATCKQPGLTDGYTCGRCHETLIEQKSITAQHDSIVDDSVAATCTTNGLSLGYHCGYCNIILVEQKEILAPGHDWSNIEYVPEDTITCTATRKCLRENCGLVETEIARYCYNVISPANEVTDGYAIYSAQFKNSAFEEQQIKVTIPKIDNTSAIEKVISDNIEVFAISNSRTVIKNADNLKYEIFDIQGRMLSKGICSSDYQTITISYKGICIVRIKNRSFKISVN